MSSVWISGGGGDLSGYVPYTGATADVNLNNNGLLAGSGYFSNGGGYIGLMGGGATDGFIHLNDGTYSFKALDLPGDAFRFADLTRTIGLLGATSTASFADALFSTTLGGTRAARIVDIASSRTLDLVDGTYTFNDGVASIDYSGNLSTEGDITGAHGEFSSLTSNGAVVINGVSPSIGQMQFTGYSMGGVGSGTGVFFGLGWNASNNKQLWIGDQDYIGNAAGVFLRFISMSGVTYLDAGDGTNSVNKPVRITQSANFAPTGLQGAHIGASSTPYAQVDIQARSSGTAWNSGGINYGFRYYDSNDNNIIVGRTNTRNVGFFTLTPDANFKVHVNGALKAASIGVDVSPATAHLHVKAGTTSVPPVKIINGTLTSTPQAGAIETDNSHIYWSKDTTNRYQLDQQVQAGSSMKWRGTIATVPSGYLFENGAAVSRTTYAALFAAIGTIYGAGNGTTTFNIPNSIDRFDIGASFDSGGCPTSCITGSAVLCGGSTTHCHAYQLTGHSHSFSGSTDTGYASISTSNCDADMNYDGSYSGFAYSVSDSGHSHSFSGSTDTSCECGNTCAGTVIPPFIASASIIKT